jgi:beta-lactam-binding protein with PASTA domain
VALRIGVGAGRVSVPNVVGGTLAQAERRLSLASLSLGQASPVPARPKSAVVSQIPSAGQVVREGSPVAVFLVTARSGGGGAVPAVKQDDS